METVQRLEQIVSAISSKEDAVRIFKAYRQYLEHFGSQMDRDNLDYCTREYLLQTAAKLDRNTYRLLRNSIPLSKTEIETSQAKFQQSLHKHRKDIGYQFSEPKTERLLKRSA